ncbi:hypothetical protein DICPUDRAFT_155855 [Dictyostelium purpureum]|uniref:Uncharacterized protein n=1 Tax=Dictyostelium purpureum TaxID=5786 RepID=F0ZV23_DICPU|nr:uncharacterized protein DICPUDRAFT_155855 [Dictyostelium purpureum]EGC32194.1 hypothetical protein DICPUDRAFT_155855 [Dictyostelium purpureum]|eukprot:XP_003291266.1 hypothetical protein DICPUDRAFT_155855 [Dictyostelium purpureum]
MSYNNSITDNIRYKDFHDILENIAGIGDRLYKRRKWNSTISKKGGIVLSSRKVQIRANRKKFDRQEISSTIKPILNCQGIILKRRAREAQNQFQISIV